MKERIGIDTLHLFPVLDKLLIELLLSLTEEEWQAQTVAKLWKVKDVASHLLDGNLRALSISRDGYFGEKPQSVDSYQDLVAFLNGLNLSWTNATKRLSPPVLIQLLKTTGAEYIEHLKTLDPYDTAIFSVAWAGEETSPNWFHIAREYTEKFLHQQQIRDAVARPGLLTKELFYPFINTLVFAFPFTFREVDAPQGTVVSLRIDTEIGGQWNIIKSEKTWLLERGNDFDSASLVTLDPNTAWKLFSKSLRPQQVLDNVSVEGDQRLGKQTLEMVSVMA